MWITLGILIYLVFWLTCIAAYAVHYLSDTIQITSFSQVLYTLSAGTEGAEGTVGAAVAGFFQSYWLLLIIGTVIFAYYIYLCIERNKAKKENHEFFAAKTGRIFSCSVIGTAIVISCLFGAELYRGWHVLGIQEYVENVNRVSQLYEDHFVDPSEVTIEFPKEKRNLIHIVVESLESSYTNQENGGAYQEDLIPSLYKMAKSGTDFSPSGTKELNGAIVTNNSGWTVAGLVAMSAGLPLNVGNDSFNRNFKNQDQFLPHITTLGEILESNGYKNFFMCGSDGSFAGRSNYYEQHGDYTIYDYQAALKEEMIPAGYHVWWGFEDAKLFSWAEEKLETIAKEDQPFNFTLLTADTHFPDGYPCELCENKYDSQYKNVVACTDRQIANFVDWVSKQDFYKDTTIVITGDHLSMDGSVGKSAPEDYERQAYAVVINGPDYTLKKTRQFTTLDIFPTIIEALGAKIEGHRLGLGTSLYSEALTLLESMGEATLNAELSADSQYYTDVILSGDDSKLPIKTNTSTSEETSQTSEAPTTEEPPMEYEAPIPPYYEEPAERLENPDYVYSGSSNEEESWTPPAQTYPSQAEDTTDLVVTTPTYTPTYPTYTPTTPTTPEPTVPDTPIVDTPVVDTPIVDTPIVDTPVVDTPVVEPIIPIVPDIPVVDTPTVEAPITDPYITPSTPVVDPVTPPATQAETLVEPTVVDPVTIE